MFCLKAEGDEIGVRVMKFMWIWWETLAEKVQKTSVYSQKNQILSCSGVRSTICWWMFN